MTGGIDALGEVTIRIQDNGKTFLGYGADTDIVVASATAYLTALNKVRRHGRAAEMEAEREREAVSAVTTRLPNFGNVLTRRPQQYW